jgi:multidrug efflux pump subunit AcrB
VLASIAGELEQSFQGISGLRDVTNSAAAAEPELDIDVDRARAAQAGVSGPRFDAGQPRGPWCEPAPARRRRIWKWPL